MLIIYTEEEQKHIKEIQDSFVPEWERLTREIHNRDGLDQPASKEVMDLYLQRQAVYDSMVEMLDAYADKCQRARFNEQFNYLTPVSVIIADAKQQAPIILENIHREIVRDYEGLNEETLQEMGIGTIKKGKLLVDTELATTWLKEELKLHIEAIRSDKDNLQMLLGEIIKAVNDSPYTDKEKPKRKSHTDPLNFTHMPLSITPNSALLRANMPMYHGKPTDALAALSHKDIENNTITDKAIIQADNGEYKIVILDFSKVRGSITVNTHKLLSTGIAEFTQINNYGAGMAIPKVTIPFNDYARASGYEIDERPTDTPEAAAKEKKRAQEAMKTARKRIKQDLELLQAMRWSWTEKIKGKMEDFESIVLLDRVAIKKGYIIMEFGRNMAEYLKKLPITQYPKSLLGIPGGKTNAYLIGLEMAEHYSMNNNQLKGTANRLKVSTLLDVTNLPTIEDLQNEKTDDSRHWDRRIKKHFENALNALKGIVIKEWKYTRTKGAQITPAEVNKITSFEEYASLLVQFELMDAPDHAARLARRAEDKKKAAAKKAAKEGQGKAKRGKK